MKNTKYLILSIHGIQVAEAAYRYEPLGLVRHLGDRVPIFDKCAHFPPPHLLSFQLPCQTNISEILSQFVNFLTHCKASQYSEIGHFGSNTPFWNGNY